MKHALLAHLACPQDGGSLRLEAPEEAAGEIKSGRLVCPTGHTHPIRNFIPRFADTAEYARTFSAQREYVRRHFRAYEKDRSGFELFYATTGWSRPQIGQGLCLEIGCGYGRFVDVVQQEGGEIVGVDVSTQSIELAHSFVGLRPRVHLVQADLFQLPFKRGLFGNVYSIGVLHHTPDCRGAFESLLPYVAPGGRIAIWLYHPANQDNVAKWRERTTTWSTSKLYAWCIFNQTALGWIRYIPWVRWKFSAWVPGIAPRRGQSFWLRVMEDFDNLSPKHASSHREEEVVGWFQQAGLVDVRSLARRTAVSGLRPAAPQSIEASALVAAASREGRGQSSAPGAR